MHRCPGNDDFENLSGGFVASVKDALAKFCYSYLPKENKEDTTNKTE